MKKTKTETMWIITCSFELRGGKKWTGAICNHVHMLKREAIKSFLKNYGHDWTTAKKAGYNVVKAQITYKTT